ncbi:hypothetical protein [Larsenimonas salina]|uniref:hypothetical protein n=1 Tax=Larsenimonas salina TaxID=1295565 RepID=UPI002072C6E6|nr:hypothetical protein [Larsenimonas salina]MCM5703883.1 hypothetical protein [Larsenimonas salina]
MRIKSMGWGLCLMLAATGAQAAWQIEPGTSHAQAEVTHDSRTDTVTLDRLGGTITDEGQLTVPLQYNQLDIVRNANIPTWLKDKTNQRMATLETTIDPDWLNDLNIGETAHHRIALETKDQRYTTRDHVPITITRNDRTHYQVTTSESVEIKTQPLMEEPNAQLIMSLLGYRSLGDTIPLSLNATLSQQ